MNKIALALIVRNEEAMLRKTLPVLAPCFRWKFAFDTGSTDRTKDVLRENCFGEIRDYKWRWDFAKARNDLAEYCRHKGMDWVFFFDADESMWPHDVSRVKDCLDLAEAFGFPRYNLIGDHRHWESWSYPDIQNRLYKLNREWFYKNKVHEILCHPSETIPKILHDVHLFHYGSVKPPKEVWLKHNNYKMIREGGSPEFELPEDVNELTDEQFNSSHPTRPGEDFSLDNPLH